MKLFLYYFAGDEGGGVMAILAEDVHEANSLAVDKAKMHGIPLFLDRDKPEVVDMSKSGVVYFDYGS